MAESRRLPSRVFEGEWVDEGYDLIGIGDRNGWRAMAGWGEDGWDLGNWPYVVVLFRDRSVSETEVAFERATYVEGDITIDTYDSREERERATDETAVFYWRTDPERHGLAAEFAAIAAGGAVPDRLRGPYRRRDQIDGAKP